MWAQRDQARQQVRSLGAQVKASRAAPTRADWALAPKSVRSPVAGLVQDTLFYQGDWVPAGSPV